MDGFCKGKCQRLYFWSYVSVCAVYKGKIPDAIQELRIKASKHIEKGDFEHKT
jgi:hypothetical protein